MKAINRLAFPAILTGIAEPVISLMDVAFIGKTGTTQLAAVGIASGFYVMSVWILAQNLTAIAAIVSRHYGKNRLGEVASLVPQALLINLALGVGFYFLTSAFSTRIFEWYKADGEVLAACNSYYAIRSIGYPFSLGAMLLFGVFRGLQNTSWAMIISLTGAAINGILDYLLIFGVEGWIEPLGLRGAACASLSAQVWMLALALIFLLRFTPFTLRISLRPSPHLKWLLRMSGDLLVRTLMLNLTFYLATRYATGYGKAQVAAHTIALNIWLFSSFFIDGYAHAGNAIAGRLLGEDKTDGLFHLGKKIARISLWIGTALGAIYAAGYPVIAEFFTGDTTVIDLFNGIFWLVIISQPVNGLAFSFDGIYKGLGMTAFLRNVLIGATLLVFLPVAVAFHYLSPSLTGIWVAFLAWMIFRAAIPAADFKKRFGTAKSYPV